MLLDKFIQDVKNNPRPQPKEVVFNPRATVTMNPDLLLDALRNVSTIPTETLYKMMTDGYRFLLNKKFIDINTVTVARAFVDEKFISIFAQVLSMKVDEFSSDEKVSCNRLIYEYIIYKNNNKATMAKMYNLARTLNRDIIPKLYGFGLEDQTIMDLVISRYSTNDEALAMKRVNRVIINSDVYWMTEQNIVIIYERLFDRLIPMFEGIMYDVWDKEKMRPDQEEIYGRITLAILTILENAPEDAIIAVLTNFAQNRQLLNQEKPLRINLRAIAVSDYARVVNAINKFEIQDKLFSLV